jgi:hypothetical protein
MPISDQARNQPGHRSERENDEQEKTDCNGRIEQPLTHGGQK